MLDRVKVLSQLQSQSDKVFRDVSGEYTIARESFDRIIADPHFQEKINAVSLPWLIPSWQGELDAIFPLKHSMNSYAVLAVDGSQVYPDRHQGTGCFLINIGTVLLNYGNQLPVILESVPYVYAEPEEDEEDLALSPDLINCKRQELEFKIGVEQAKKFREKNTTEPLVFLFDGSLIFWHLESKDQRLKELFVGKYVASLHDLYVAQIPCAGYISLPKSKELVNLIRVELCNFVIEGCTRHSLVNAVVDSAVAGFFLEPETRTTVFKSNASIGSSYPEHLMPHFFYADIGSEIIRVEIPAWVAQDEEILNRVSTIILDQAKKGSGYPVAIAESHEQAVVKGPDREFFYHLITKIGLEKKQRLIPSQKSMKKRGLGI